MDFNKDPDIYMYMCSRNKIAERRSMYKNDNNRIDLKIAYILKLLLKAYIII